MESKSQMPEMKSNPVAPSEEGAMDNILLEDEKPEYETVETSIATNVDLPIVPKKGRIEVIATRPGFFGQHRKVEGDKFFVSKVESLGNWMICIDPIEEKKRLKFLAKKKKGE